MLQLRKSVRAKRDLVEIWRYSRKHWNEAQADAYLDLIDDALKRLCRHPAMGVDVDELLSGARRWKVGSHHIYYVVAEGSLLVVRVLGARQDPPRHLEE